MMFEPGDLVEIISAPDMLMGNVKPGMRGTIVRFCGVDVCAWPGGPWIQGSSWIVEFPETEAICATVALRKIPPDPGRSLVRWDQCEWRPARVLQAP